MNIKVLAISSHRSNQMVAKVAINARKSIEFAFDDEADADDNR